ncbi:MAG: hypothetical protein Q7U54_00210 [Bacteroidales bacterium]|nr:hypothetical protein [Bacteroidales bacterium]
MIHFNLNIDTFYDLEYDNGIEVKAIACIEYPILHIIAKTLEVMEEDYDELDKFIVQTSLINVGFSIQEFTELTGLSPEVFIYRANELVKQDYITFKAGIITPKETGLNFLNNPVFKREIQKTRSFVIDGITHKPLQSYFYKEGKEYLISEYEKDNWGNKIFNPSIIHNPPTNKTIELILSVPIEERSSYNIPVGLIEILDFDFVLLTYPLAVEFSTDSEKKINKKIIDGFSRYMSSSSIEIWQEMLENEIGKLEVLIEEKAENRSRDTKKIQLKNNWGSIKYSSSDKIFSFTSEQLKYFICKNYNISNISNENILSNEYELSLCIDSKLFLTEGVNKKKLIEACIRKRDYIYQYPGIGVWLVFIKIIIGDDFIQNLVSLYSLLQEIKSVEEILTRYNNDYQTLRQYLVALEQFETLEKLDIFLFLYSRNSNPVYKNLN